MKANDLQELKELQGENTRVKEIVVDSVLVRWLSAFPKHILGKKKP